MSSRTVMRSCDETTAAHSSARRSRPALAARVISFARCRASSMDTSSNRPSETRRTLFRRLIRNAKSHVFRPPGATRMARPAHRESGTRKALPSGRNASTVRCVSAAAERVHPCVLANFLPHPWFHSNIVPTNSPVCGELPQSTTKSCIAESQ